jgi:hypothetical protein
MNPGASSQTFVPGETLVPAEQSTWLAMGSRAGQRGGNKDKELKQVSDTLDIHNLEKDIDGIDATFMGMVDQNRHEHGQQCDSPILVQKDLGPKVIIAF